MARITIEDCVEKIHDRFELVALAAQRAKDINSGSEVTIDNAQRCDKAPVVALREIAADHLTVSTLRTRLLKRLRTKSRIDPIDEDNTDTNHEEVIEDFDYLPSGSDLCITEDYSNLDEPLSDDDTNNHKYK